MKKTLSVRSGIPYWIVGYSAQMRSYRVETHSKYPVHVVTTFVSSFFVQRQFLFDKLKEEVKGLFAVVGRFLEKNTEQIDASRVC